jgi:NDP-sugar pyrophosphorylase family protein
MRAIILAGGKGTRLLPYTIVIPKPMLPIGHIPIIEIIARQLFNYGFSDVTVSVGHLSGMIEVFLETLKGEVGIPNFKVFKETVPLGTSGPIKAIAPAEEDFLVVNGDILTTLNMKKMYQAHLESDAVLTIAVRQTEYQLPLGSITISEGGWITDFQEKPKSTHFDNIGAYVYAKEALQYIEDEEKIDVNILVHRLLEDEQKILAFRSDGPYFWIDIGTHADYEKANEQFEKLRPEFPFLKEVE